MSDLVPGEVADPAALDNANGAAPSDGQDAAPQGDDGFRLSNGTVVPRAEVERVLGDVEGFKKGFQGEYTKKRMKETEELKNLQRELATAKAASETAQQFSKFKEFLRTKSPDLYKQLAQAEAEANLGAPVRDTAPQEGTPMSRRELPPSVHALVLREEVRDFEQEAGMTLTPEQKRAVFAKQLELETEFDRELPVALVAKAVLFDSMKLKAGQAGKPPVKPTLGGQSAPSRAPGPQSEEAKEKELLDLMRG